MRDSTKAGFIGRGGQREDSGLTRVPREPEEGPLRRRLSGHWPKLPQRPCQRSTFRRRSHIIVWIVGNRTKLRVGARTDPFPLNLSLHCCTVRNRALRTVYYCVCVDCTVLCLLVIHQLQLPESVFVDKNSWNLFDHR